jgi:hypothetical protein
MRLLLMPSSAGPRAGTIKPIGEVSVQPPFVV